MRDGHREGECRMTDQKQPDPDDPRRELDDTAEFDVPNELADQGPLFMDDLNGHDGNFPGGDADLWRVIHRDPEP